MCFYSILTYNISANRECKGYFTSGKINVYLILVINIVEM